MFNHQNKQRQAAFADGLCLQSALNFLCPTEEKICFGNATFGADGWPNYPAASERSAAK